MKMKQILSKMNVQIAIYVMVISFALVLTVSWIAYYIASQIIFVNIQKQTGDAISQTSDYISAYLDKIKTLSDVIAMHPQAQEALQQSDSKAVSALVNMVNVSANSDERIQTIAVISKNGFAITSNSNMAVPLSDDMMAEQWYKKAVQSNQMPVINTIRHADFNEDKSNWVISISHEIVSAEKEHLGVVLIDVSYKFIEDYISKLPLGKNGYAYILDGANHILYHPDETILMDEMKAGELLEISKADEFINHKMQFITKKTIPHSDWLLVGVSSMENVEELKTQFMQAIFLVNIGIIGVGVFISWMISKRLSKPITELQKAMIDVDENWGHIRLENKGSYEIQALADEYNRLLDRIKALTEDIAQKEESKRVFELKALQSQINPHFLYNTLDTILWLAEFGENQKVIEVSKALGEMLRISLNINQTVVPLEQEIQHTENYLKIQQQRYLDKIQYRISGDKSLLGIEVPKLILQPIVENAIYHGIRPLKEMATIEIRYEKQGEDLLIFVKNDGISYQEESRSEDKSTVKTKLGGIGLQNVDQRIKILHGKEYGLTIKAIEPRGTEVCYRLKRF